MRPLALALGTLALVAACAAAGPDVVLVHPDTGVQRRCMTINTQVTRPNPWYGVTAIPAHAGGQQQALSEQGAVPGANETGWLHRTDPTLAASV